MIQIDLWNALGVLLCIGNLLMAAVLRDRRQALICWFIGLACLVGVLT